MIVKRFLLLICLMLYPIVLFSLGNNDSHSFSANYNKALQNYQDGNWDESERLLQNLPNDLSKKNEIEKLKLYSSIKYKTAEESLQSADNRNEALNSVDSSIGFLKRILELKPQDERTAHNLEKALILKNQLKENEQRGDNNQDQSDKPLEEQLKDLSEEQENLANEENKDNEQHESAQNDLNSSTEDLSRRSNQDNQDFNESLEKAMESQKNASEALENNDFDRAEEEQKNASEFLEQAINRLNPQPQEETQEEVPGEDLVDSILQDEREREDQNSQTSEGITVERNW